MTDPERELADELELLRQEFLRGLPGRITDLNAHLARIDGSAGSWTAVDDLAHTAHRMCGTAGTFGLHELGLVARQLERRTHEFDRTQGGPLPAELAELQSFVLRVAELAASGHESPSSAQASHQADQTHRIARGRGLIYCLDDDEVFAQALKLQLEALGYEIVTIPTPGDLHEAIRSETPALVIMDVSLLVEGAEKNRVLTARDAVLRDEIPVICLSRQDDLPTRLACVRAGGGAFFRKPVDPEAFSQTIEDLTASGTSDPFRILVVDDDMDSCDFHALLLRRADMQVSTVNDPARFMIGLEESRPDLILMDFHLPGCTGLELARVIRQDSQYLSVPIVYLSGDDDPQVRQAAMDQGGDEFLIKPVDPSLLISTVESRAGRGRTLRSLMLTDGLTGLNNHSTIKIELDLAVSRAARVDEPLSVAMIDLDDFKQINDTYGHAVGDRVLRTFSWMLRRRLRETDIAGRFGGEEFVVVLPGADAAAAFAVIEEIREAFASIRFDAQQRHFFITCSAGVASVESHETASSLLLAADAALYAAKDAGKNQVHRAS